MNIEDFAGTTPPFLPEVFFAGEIEGWSVVERLTGGSQRRFRIKAAGSRDAVARISSRGEGLYSGVESRIDGEA